MANRLERDRQPRTYPHGSGDRNAWSPTGKERMPRHEGGTQREAPPEYTRRKPRSPASP